jgi:predicted enzyme related to lactoylglutathione lyase
MIRDRAGNMFELLQMTSPPCFGPRERRPMDQLGLTHLAFWVDDIDQGAARVRAAGGKSHESTRTTFRSGVEMIYCTDPDGVRVELLKPAPA